MIKALNSISLGELARHLDLSEQALSTVEKFFDFKLTGLAAVASAKETEACFIGRMSYLSDLEKSNSRLVVITESLRAKVPPSWEKDRIFLVVENPMIIMARASAFFHKEEWGQEGIHPAATVAKDAKLGKGVRIGANCTVESMAELGEGVVLQAGSYVGRKVTIGSDCIFFPNVVLYDGIRIGSRVRVHASTTLGSDGFGYAQSKRDGKVEHVKIHHLGSLVIGDDVEIGAGTTIDRGTLGDTFIGNQVIIDNQVQIGHNCLIEDGSIVCGSTALAGNSILRSGASVGGFCRLNNGAEIGAGATLAGDSTLVSKVPPGEVWRGNPAMDMKSSLRVSASEMYLPEMRRWFVKWRKSRHSSEEKQKEENTRGDTYSAPI